MKVAGKKANLMPPSKGDMKTKKTGKTNGKSNKLGGGGRFQQLENKGMSGGLAAYIGRKLHGSAAMAKMAAKGKKSA